MRRASAAYSSPSFSGLCREPGWYQRATSMASDGKASNRR